MAGGEEGLGGTVGLGCKFPSDDFPVPFSPFFCGDPFCCCPVFAGGTDWALGFPLPFGFYVDGGDLSGNFSCFRVSIE